MRDFSVTGDQNLRVGQPSTVEIAFLDEAIETGKAAGIEAAGKAHAGILFGCWSQLLCRVIAGKATCLAVRPGRRARPSSLTMGTNRTASLPARPLIAMIALAIFIHALDRNLCHRRTADQGRAGPHQHPDRDLLLSAFFWTYVPGHVLAGWLIEKLNARRALALALAVWSLATVLTGFATSFAMLLVLRLLLGLGESAGFPASSKLLAEALPREKLGTANGLVGAGLMLGNGLGVLLGGMVLAAMGWQALFFVFGGISLLWLLPWLAMTSGRKPLIQPTEPAPPAPGYAVMLARRETWAAAGDVLFNYPYFIVLSWLPLYLVKQQGFAITTMAWLGGLVYLLGAAINFWAGRGSTAGLPPAPMPRACANRWCWHPLPSRWSACWPALWAIRGSRLRGCWAIRCRSGLVGLYLHGRGRQWPDPAAPEMDRLAERIGRPVGSGRPAGYGRADRRDRRLPHGLPVRGAGLGGGTVLLGGNDWPGRAARLGFAAAAALVPLYKFAPARHRLRA